MEIDERTPALVVAGVDGSATDRSVLVRAASEAAARGRLLHVVHCAAAADERAVRLTEGSAAWLRSRSPSVLVVAGVVVGRPGPGLVGHVRLGDLVVIGAGHRSAATGSTAAHVLSHVRGEVVIAAEDTWSVHGPYRGHVVAVIGSHCGPETTGVVAAAFRHACAHGSDLVVLQVCDVQDRITPLLVERSLPPRTCRLVDSWHASHPHVRVSRVVAEGRRAAILRHVGVGAQAVLVGRAHAVADATAVAAAGCVMVVPPPTHVDADVFDGVALRIEL